MAFKTALWRVDGKTLSDVSATRLNSESRLEDWISADSSILGLDLLFVGRQVQTGHGGRIDLIGLDSDANVVLVELKRDKTPRDVIAQTLDYASWVSDLTFDQLDGLAQSYCSKSLPGAFRDHFDEPLPDVVNASHSMIVVASELDDASERIVDYLQRKVGLGISAVFFNFYQVDGKELLARSWLHDPEEVSVKATSRNRAPWSGDWFVNIGDEIHSDNSPRDWEDCRKYGFVAAGGGPKWSGQLERLPVGARIFAYSRGGLGERGYVGVGTVTFKPVPVSQFIVEKEGKPLLDLPLRAKRMHDRKDDPEKTDYTVAVHWERTVSRDQPKWFKGAFAKQHVACKLRDPATLEFLKKEFGLSDS